MSIIYPLDFAIFVWGIAGTYKIRQQVQLLGKQKKYSYQPIVLTTVIFILVPLIVLRLNLAKYSDFSIVLVCIEIFWFGFLASRGRNIA
ncbi:MAG: hypothetical protein GY727_07755 [Gammaproteobacteria bacterium]|nr:hypothetical protein [Gammaproteobacteria bacterium]MCP4277940.1 hypothetical protein [Gammaproteobacteria bacterium]MCP4832535.1 hypothetical protein [Gammaproteobacteria bacterium]MCP4928683.1 hypothetical protein [Gammaproteobacteria bacterium]